MLNRTQILESINWKEALKAPRSAGGHESVMESIFYGSAVDIVTYNEGNYQGSIAYAYLFKDGTVVLITDYYGSCSGCDSWEDADEETARGLITSMVTSCRIHPSVKSAYNYCKKLSELDEDDSGFEYTHMECRHLKEGLKDFLFVVNEVKKVPSKSIFYIKSYPELRDYFCNLSLKSSAKNKLKNEKKKSPKKS